MLLLKELSKTRKITKLIISVIVFGFLYFLCDVFLNFKIESPMDYLHFSLITQTTVGYGILNNKFTQKYENNFTDDNKKNIFHIINSFQLLTIFFLL